MKKAKFDTQGWDKLKPSLEDFTLGRGKDLLQSRRGIAAFHFGITDKLSPDFWPCCECCGSGRIYDPTEQPDPIEGRKFATVIACPECKGTGNIGKKKFAELFKAGYDKWKGEMDRYKMQTALLKRIFRNLSEDEHEALYKYHHR